MMVFIALTFGKVFYLGPTALPWFFVCLFFLGLGGANFAVYTLWLPEQYPTECRASAFAFSTSFARFGGAGITFLVGSGVRHYGSLGTPVALTSIAFALGLLSDSVRHGNPRPALAGLNSAQCCRHLRRSLGLLPLGEARHSRPTLRRLDNAGCQRLQPQQSHERRQQIAHNHRPEDFRPGTGLMEQPGGARSGKSA